MLLFFSTSKITTKTFLFQCQHLANFHAMSEIAYTYNTIGMKLDYRAAASIVHRAD